MEPRLELDGEELEAIFRECSKGVHPDAGGATGEFEALREARDTLADPARRLDAWLAVREIAPTHSGAVPERVATMFQQVGEVTARVDGWLAKGDSVASGLGRALWQKEGFGLKENLEKLMEEISTWEDDVVARFPEIEQSSDPGSALGLRGELGFLRKWKAMLRERYGRIWEGLV